MDIFLNFTLVLGGLAAAAIVSILCGVAFLVWLAHGRADRGLWPVRDRMPPNWDSRAPEHRGPA